MEIIIDLIKAICPALTSTELLFTIILVYIICIFIKFIIYKIKMHNNYENAVNAFFDNFVINTRQNAKIGPKLKFTKIELVLAPKYVENKQKNYNLYDKDKWQRYSILLEASNNLNMISYFNDLCINYDIRDRTNFKKWLYKKSIKSENKANNEQKQYEYKFPIMNKYELAITQIKNKED